MGMQCPNGHGWQPFKRSITKDGAGAETAKEVLARVLGCGCVIGGEMYNTFIVTSNAIDVEARGKILDIERVAKEKKAALWKSLTETTEGA